MAQAGEKTGDKASPSGAPPKNPVAELYGSMASLAPQTQMFMDGCAPELDAKFHRILSRGIVMRNLFALSAGVQKTVYWYLPAVPIPGDGRYNLMALMYGKIGLLALEDGVFGKRYPGADAFERMTKALNGVQRVKRVNVPGKPSIFLFEVDRGARGTAYVAWERRDAFSGEDSPAIPFDWQWRWKTASALDAEGHAVPAKVADGVLHLDLSLTPILIEPGG